LIFFAIEQRVLRTTPFFTPLPQWHIRFPLAFLLKPPKARKDRGQKV